MEMNSQDSMKEEIMNSNPEFRELAREHGKYEARLGELSALQYPSDDEQWEEATLKKKKLVLKDQMQELLWKYQNTRSTVH